MIVQSVSIRPAVDSDVPLIHDLVKDLAVYEELEDAFVSTEEAIRNAIFGPQPYAEVLIGELHGRPVGFALFFHNFSTFLGQRGLYLEDLFVRPEFRGNGVGKALLKGLAKIAVDRNCARMEWSVLDWNTPSIEFYSSLGAAPMSGWSVFRLGSQEISSLAAIEGQKKRDSLHAE